MLERYRPTVSVAATIAVVAVLSFAGSLLANRVPESLGHALSHLVVAVPVAVLAVLAVRWWPPPREGALGRAARRIVLLGLTGVASGQILEAVGARVDEPGAGALEGVAHTVGQVVGMLSVPVLLLGAGVAALAAARAGAAPVWLVAVGVVAAVALFVFLVVGGH